MSILVDKNTKVITQGITGKTGQFHTRACRDYANGRNCFVAGVNPKKPGEEFEGIPIFGTVREAKQVGLKVPLVVRLEGTNVDLGKKILADSGLPIISASDMGDAAKKVVAAAKGVAVAA